MLPLFEIERGNRERDVSKLPEITYESAMAAGRDAGSRSMRAGGRTKWVVKDWNVACETFSRLWRGPKAEQGSQPARSGKGKVKSDDQ